MTLDNSISAGQVPPSKKTYRVVYAHSHPFLFNEDVVVMVETPDLQNLLLRLADMTLHSLADGHGQYVHLQEVHIQ